MLTTTLTFQGNPVHTAGKFPHIGEIAPDFILVDAELDNIGLDTYAGKRKLLNIVPSLDTPTCAASARKFNEKAAHFHNTVVLVISADLPFAQCRFCSVEDLHHLVALSTFRSSFAQDYGVAIVDTVLAGLTARAVIILDEQDRVLYTELVSELTDEPNYDAALLALKSIG